MAGTSQRPSTVVYDSAPPRPNGLAVASLVLGIVGIVLGIVPLFVGLVLSFVPALLAILFGLIGLARTAATRSGFVPAFVGAGLGVLTVVLWFHGYGTLW
jgi:hypothetical protein